MNRVNTLRLLRRLSQPSSLSGLAALAVVAHISAPQFAALADAFAVICGLAAIYLDDGSTPTAPEN